MNENKNFTEKDRAELGSLCELLTGYTPEQINQFDLLARVYESGKASGERKAYREMQAKQNEQKGA